MGIDLNDVLKALMSKAMEDGVLSDQETEMITNIMHRFEDYKQILEDALADDLITVDEKAKLYSFRANIFAENLHYVNEDQIVTKDEMVLLNTLRHILTELGEKETSNEI